MQTSFSLSELNFQVIFTIKGKSKSPEQQKQEMALLD